MFNILGIGTDVVQIPRIEAIFNKYGQKFVAKILSSAEQESGNITSSYLAKRFAGKEAVAKALGFGIGKSLRFNEISIINNIYGKPEVVITKYDIMKDIKIDISLSDDYPIALAFVIISPIK